MGTKVRGALWKMPWGHSEDTGGTVGDMAATGESQQGTWGCIWGVTMGDVGTWGS